MHYASLILGDEKGLHEKLDQSTLGERYRKMIKKTSCYGDTVTSNDIIFVMCALLLIFLITFLLVMLCLPLPLTFIHMYYLSPTGIPPAFNLYAS